MNETILTHVDTEAQIHDLRELVSEWRVVQLVLIEVQALGDETGGGEVTLVPHSRVMLTLLTYCYAVGIYSSEDIEWACYNDSGASYICANKPADVETVQQFRRAYWMGIETCLARVLSAAAGSQPLTITAARPLVSAHQKLETAIMMDTAMAD